jgi:hypothetical protein
MLSRGITRSLGPQVLLRESEKLEQMRICVGMVGIVIACTTDLQWARILFAFALLLQGVEQAAVLIVLGATGQGTASGPHKNKMAMLILTSASVTSLVLAVAGLMVLAFGF